MNAHDGFDIERLLVAHARSTGPLRATLAEIAGWLVERRAWERLGYARLSDYADERTDLSARSLYDLAHVGRALRGLPRLRTVLIQGTLGWTKVRLIARVASEEDEQGWIDLARGLTSAALSKEVRRVDRGSLETDALERDRSMSRRFEVECSRETRRKWSYAQQLARRVHGGRVSLSECLEMVTAETLSALPIDAEAMDSMDAERTSEDESPQGISWALAAETAHACYEDPVGPDGELFSTTVSIASGLALGALLRDLEHADAFELDRRLHQVIAMRSRVDAEMGPLLEVVLRKRVYRLLEYATVDRYVRERLGMDPSWGRVLTQIERVARRSTVFSRAYREGRITALQAKVLVPLVMAELSEKWMTVWIERARGFTLRRLREDVDAALLVRETDGQAWLQTGGLPEEDAASGHGGEEGDEDPIGKESSDGAGESGANQSGREGGCWVRAIVDADVRRLARAVLCTVRRRIERLTGRLPGEGEAFEVMLKHALHSWGAYDEKLRRSHAVFARDGWRCVVPGCTSMRNLHDHHIHFRAAGGSDALDNRVTLCAFHHLRGVHSGVIRCRGTAADDLQIALGVRPGVPSLAVYTSGDRLLSGKPSRIKTIW